MSDFRAPQPIDSGTYRIFAIDFPDGSISQRRADSEDDNLLPKRVFNNKSTNITQFCNWTVVRKPSSKYVLRVFGAPTGVLRTQLVGFLNGEEHAEWVIKPALSVTGKLGWSVSINTGESWSTVEAEEQPTTPVKVVQLVVQPGDPPRFPRGAVFEFEKCDLRPQN